MTDHVSPTVSHRLRSHTNTGEVAMPFSRTSLMNVHLLPGISKLLWDVVRVAKDFNVDSVPKTLIKAIAKHSTAGSVIRYGDSEHLVTLTAG